MQELAIKKWLGVLTGVVENPDDPTCGQPLAYDQAIARMMMGIPVLGRALAAHGIDSTEVLAAVISFGGLALNALLTARGALEGPGRIDALRAVGRELVDNQPSVAYLVHNDWLLVDPQVGPYHQLVTEVLGAKAACARAGTRERHAGLDACMFVVLDLAIVWMHRMEVRRGAAQDDAIPPVDSVVNASLGELLPFDRRNQPADEDLVPGDPVVNDGRELGELGPADGPLEHGSVEQSIADSPAEAAAFALAVAVLEQPAKEIPAPLA